MHNPNRLNHEKSQTWEQLEADIADKLKEAQVTIGKPRKARIIKKKPES